jgi:hypothetical protein
MQNAWNALQIANNALVSLPINAQPAVKDIIYSIINVIINVLHRLSGSDHNIFADAYIQRVQFVIQMSFTIIMFAIKIVLQAYMVIIIYVLNVT